MNTSSLVLIPAILLLSACGGSGDAPVTSGPLSVDEVGELVLTLGEAIEVEANANNFAPASALPTSNTFEYSGFIAVAQTNSPANDPTSAIGTVALTLDLAANEISGTATNFYDQGATPMVGSIPLENGTLVRRNLGNAGTAIEGLEFLSNASNPLIRNGSPYGWGEIYINGDLFGSNAEYISGSGTGSVVLNGTTVGITVGIGAEK